ncbi:hypothetical protein ER611_09265, partial [Streptococcus pyogenes]
MPYARNLLLAALASSPLAACSSGNIRTAGSYSAPAAPQVQNPNYDPYAAPGTVNATWAPPVLNRNGTIVKPNDPRGAMAGRPDYE